MKVPSSRQLERLRPGDVLQDERGNALALQEELGSGGQGVVWSLVGEQAAVKILKPERGEGDRDAAAMLRTRLATVRRFDLAGIPIARPLSLLVGDYVGYTMELLAGMKNIGTLAALPGSGAADWYHGTGGLRRRLRVLALAAEALSRLHGRAIAYGDVSPNNILVSASSAHDQVWLIDPDNLSVESSPADIAFITDGYAAPELIERRAGYSSLTDSFAFAVVAFQVLVLAHPFVGDDVYADPGTLEPRAFAGRLPWIDHPEDDSNRSSQGLDRGIVLTKGLRALAGRTFEQGLHSPDMRPSMQEWHEKLDRASLLTIVCPKCRGTYYASAPLCPWCREQARPPLVLCDVHGYVPAEGYMDADRAAETDRLQSMVLTTGEPLVVRARNALLCMDRGPSSVPVHPGEPVVEIEWDGKSQVMIQRTGRSDVWMVDQSTRRATLLRVGEFWPLELGESGRWSIHFGPLDEMHRFVRVLRARTSAG